MFWKNEGNEFFIHNPEAMPFQESNIGPKNILKDSSRASIFFQFFDDKILETLVSEINSILFSTNSKSYKIQYKNGIDKQVKYIYY